MLTEPTLEKLKTLRLYALGDAWTAQQKDPETVATFVPNERSDYTIKLPSAGDQLQTVEVKQAGAKQDPNATSDIQLLARAVWSLQIQSS